MWECPCVDCVLSSIFGLRADFDVDTSHIFPQGMLNAITLLGWLVLGDLKPVQSERWDFLSAKRSSLPCPGWGPFDGCSGHSCPCEWPGRVSVHSTCSCVLFFKDCPIHRSVFQSLCILAAGIQDVYTENQRSMLT